MPYPLTEWWFWVFVAPELLLFAGWLIFMLFAAVGWGAVEGWRKLTERDS